MKYVPDVKYVEIEGRTAPQRMRADRVNAAAHEARLRIINTPFPQVMPGRRVQSALPWSGLILGDRFFGDGEDGSRRHRHRTEGDQFEGDFHYGRQADR